MGTPKTLAQAIENGCSEAFVGSVSDSETSIIKSHVQDYLAQKFTPDMMDDPKIQALWARIVAKKAEAA